MIFASYENNSEGPNKDYEEPEKRMLFYEDIESLFFSSDEDGARSKIKLKGEEEEYDFFQFTPEPDDLNTWILINANIQAHVIATQLEDDESLNNLNHLKEYIIEQYKNLQNFKSLEISGNKPVLSMLESFSDILEDIEDDEEENFDHLNYLHGTILRMIKELSDYSRQFIRDNEKSGRTFNRVILNESNQMLIGGKQQEEA
jgi:hypothetical protein